jgi:hypothetical protein
MKRNLEAQIDDLYRRPLEEFTKARSDLAKALSGGEKKQVLALPKPTVPAWVINQIYWQDAASYNALIDAAEKLRAAHRAILSGRSADTRKPDQLHRATVEQAFGRALALADKRGLRLTESVRGTIRRTLMALPGDEAAGRLTHPPPPAGFSLLTGVKVRSPKPRVQGPESRVRSPKPAKESRAELQAQKRAQREKQEAERKAKAEKEKREREIEKAEQAVREAERRLAELKG